MTALIWTLIGFLSGSLPFSVWLGELVLRTDIRRYGDGNPGATNVFRAGNFAAGMLAVFLDISKGAAPVALAHYLFQVDGWPLIPVILAPIAGHAFSPFLRFRGGKAIASAFGAWTALTVPFGPFVMGGSVFLFHKLLTIPGWAVMAALAVLLAFLLLTGRGWPLLAAWAGTVLLLAWTHRGDLRQRPQLRPGVRKLLKRGARR